MGSGLRVLVVVAACVWAQPAAAQANVLDWQAPVGCPNQAALSARVASLLARSGASQERVDASGKIAARGSGFSLHLAITAHERRVVRELAGDDCASLSDAAAWLIALAADARLAADAAAASSAAVATAAASEPTATTTSVTGAGPGAKMPLQPTAAVATSSASASASAHDEAATDHVWRLRVSAFTGALAAGLAGPAISAGARLGLARDQLELAALFAHHFARTRSLEGGGKSELSVDQLAVQACWGWGDASRLALCAELDLLGVAGVAYAISQPDSARYWSVAGAASAAFVQRIDGPLSCWVEAGLLLPLTRRAGFEIEGIGRVGQLARVGGQLRAGVSWALW